MTEVALIGLGEGVKILERDYPDHFWIARNSEGPRGKYFFHIMDGEYTQSRGRRGNHYYAYSSELSGAFYAAYLKLVEGVPDDYFNLD